MSTVLEGILYGEYHEFLRCMPTNLAFFFSGFSVLMFIGTIWTFTYKQRIRDINQPSTVVATLLFVLSTAVSFLPLSSHFIR